VWENTVQPDRPQMTIYVNSSESTRFAYLVTKEIIHTHNIEYLLLFHGSNGYANAPQL
jgi:hypothetical protein